MLQFSPHGNKGHIHASFQQLDQLGSSTWIDQRGGESHIGIKQGRIMHVKLTKRSTSCVEWDWENCRGPYYCKSREGREIYVNWRHHIVGGLVFLFWLVRLGHAWQGSHQSIMGRAVSGIYSRSNSTSSSLLPMSPPTMRIRYLIND